MIFRSGKGSFSGIIKEDLGEGESMWFLSVFYLTLVVRRTSKIGRQSGENSTCSLEKTAVVHGAET
jgi:hypothetical protein